MPAYNHLHRDRLLDDMASPSPPPASPAAPTPDLRAEPIPPYAPPDDPIPNPEPASPSLPYPDPEVLLPQP